MSSKRNPMEPREPSSAKEHPILFSAPMIRAILAGKKSTTRRVIKPQPVRSLSHTADLPGGDGTWTIHRPMGWRWSPGPRGWSAFHADQGSLSDSMVLRCPYGKPGDKLWVRETWASAYGNGSWGTLFAADWAYVQGKRNHEKGPHFCASYGDRIQRDLVKWRPSIFMPRWSSRITLEITELRAERLQDISEDDAKAEGCVARSYRDGRGHEPATIDFGRLWDSINGERPGCAWRDNPWVWAISFKRVSSGERERENQATGLFEHACPGCGKLVECTEPSGATFCGEC